MPAATVAWGDLPLGDVGFDPFDEAGLLPLGGDFCTEASPVILQNLNSFEPELKTCGWDEVGI